MKNENINVKKITKIKPKKIPIYLDHLPPCNDACPAGENIQAWLNRLQNGQLFEAWETILNDNPFPAIHGRVCYHPCESACNRGKFDCSVSIHNIERFLGDLALQQNWQIRHFAPKSHKKALIIGAGPAGLSCAYHLCRRGHEVTIYEAEPYAGGMMRNGIPAYRLPRKILDAEIDRLREMDIKIELRCAIEDNKKTNSNVLLRIKEQGNFDVIFLAIGACKDKIAPIVCEKPIPIIGAIDFFKAIEKKNLPKLGQSIVIYGGGNSAIDAARSAKRLGIFDVTIVYRRDREHMPAFDFEVQEAEEEDIKFMFLRTIKEINKDQFLLETMRLNEQGKAEGEGNYEKINADMLILALGQDPDSKFLKTIPGIDFNQDSTIIVDAKMMTGCYGIFAGGDLITNKRSITTAIGHGKKAALHIDAHLSNREYPRQLKHGLALYENLHIEQGKNGIKSDAVRPSILPAKMRVQNFAEAVSGIDKDAAITEANRCFSCGNCFECDGCYTICPVKAINKLGYGKRYRIDHEKCIGCGRCFRRCPCGAIAMIDNN